MYPRNITYKLKESLADTPVILLSGARQSGKSTLVQNLANKSYKPTYYTFDDVTLLASARSDPAGFIANLTPPVILDEIQHVPEVFLPIKYIVDKARKPGSFLLTGSANVLLLPKLSDSLAGRIELHTLWPLSQQEVHSKNTDIISKLFEGGLPRSSSKVNRAELEELILAGGYPESIEREAKRRHAWFTSYIRTILERDVRELAAIEDITRFPKLLSFLATRSATLLNLSDVANSVDIPYSSLQRYFALLQATYLVVMVPAWTSNLGLRLVKSPKLLLNDTGLLTSLLGIDSGRFKVEPHLFGNVLETFVGMELKKLLGQSATRAELFHFRSHTRQEVDFVLERSDGQVVGVEVKSAGTVRGDDFRGLKFLGEKLGKKLAFGVLLYTGETTVPFGKFMAAPVSTLWA